MMTSDSEVINNYLQGDEKSIEILVKRYLKPLYSFVYKNIGDRDVAEDITQNVFLKVWKNLHKFDRQRSFKTWIFTIAKNTCIDYLRKKKSIPFSNFENEKGENVILNKLKDKSPMPNEIFEFKNFSKSMTEALENLSSHYKKILLLRYSDNLKFKEIAKITGQPLNTVKSRHRRALSELRGNMAP